MLSHNTTTCDEMVHKITQKKAEDTKMEDEEETTKTGGKEGTNDAAKRIVCPPFLVGNDSAIVGVPEKSQFSLFLHETFSVPKKSLLVANFDYNKFDQAIGKFP